MSTIKARILTVVIALFVVRYMTVHLTRWLQADIISVGRRGSLLLSQIVPSYRSDDRVHTSRPTPRATSWGWRWHHPPPVAGARDLWNVTAPHATCWNTIRIVLRYFRFCTFLLTQFSQNNFEKEKVLISSK